MRARESPFREHMIARDTPPGVPQTLCVLVLEDRHRIHAEPAFIRPRVTLEYRDSRATFRHRRTSRAPPLVCVEATRQASHMRAPFLGVNKHCPQRGFGCSGCESRHKRRRRIHTSDVGYVARVDEVFSFHMCTSTVRRVCFTCPLYAGSGERAAPGNPPTVLRSTPRWSHATKDIGQCSKHDSTSIYLAWLASGNGNAHSKGWREV